MKSTISCIKERKSIRAFLDKPVPKTLLNELMEIARWAPSSTNMQPWKVVLVTGEKKKDLDQLLLDAFDRKAKEFIELETYPDVWNEPYKNRRLQCGLGLYQALNIERKDFKKKIAQMRENFRGFGAPVALFMYMDGDLKEGSIMDCGMFLQNIMLAARMLDLETCPQAAAVQYGDILKEFLGLSPDQRILVGMAIGYADYDHPINSFRTERMELDEFLTILD